MLVAENPLNGILRVSKAPIVSRDVIGDPASWVFDPALPQTRGLVKVFGWYDSAGTTTSGAASTGSSTSRRW